MGARGHAKGDAAVERSVDQLSMRARLARRTRVTEEHRTRTPSDGSGDADDVASEAV